MKASVSMSSAIDAAISSADEAVRGTRLRDEIKCPVWKMLR